MRSAVTSYKISKQIRIENQINHYKDIVRFDSVDDAKLMSNLKKKLFLYWVCLIKLDNKDSFYSVITFPIQYNWFNRGNIIGRWNEIELIEKIKQD